MIEPIVTIESLAAGGDGIARNPDGRVIFVSGGAPGDRVRVEIDEVKKSFLRAHVLEVIEAGGARVEPRCELFRDGRCGGCQWQHVSAPAQAEAKHAIVAGALRKLVAQGLELAPIATPAPDYGWRRRARLHWVRPRKSNRAIVGLYAPRTNRVTAVDTCPQLEPALERALGAVHGALAPALTGKGELDLLAGHDGSVQVAVRGPCAPAAAEALASSDGVDSVLLGKRHIGPASIELEPGFAGRADGFAQASRAGNAALVAIVDERTRPRDGLAILELHAGSGNLTRVLAADARRVVAIDRQAPPAGLADNVEYIQGDALELLKVRRRRDEHFELVVLDPPRTGAAPLMTSVAKLGPERVLYVSCDPATLARDSLALVGKGYRAVWAQAVDLMPQTAHVEVVMVLERGTPSP